MCNAVLELTSYVKQEAQATHLWLTGHLILNQHTNSLDSEWKTETCYAKQWLIQLVRRQCWLDSTPHHLEGLGQLLDSCVCIGHLVHRDGWFKNLLDWLLWWFHRVIERFFDLIGLDFAREGPKAPEFGPVLKMLGVQIDASEATQGAFAGGHTESRKQELVKTFEDAIETGHMSSKVAESIRGRMVFYEWFAAGRTTNLLLREFGKLCRSDRVGDELTSEDLVILVALRGRVAHARPISISASFMDT